MMEEIGEMESKQEAIKKENANLRQSLDEAIKRLHNNEEDVIDRSLIKNILLDWYSKSGKSKREVLQVMSSLLHFTEADKEKCGISENSPHGLIGSLAPPLNPPPGNIDGDNIREKFVNFLIAETGESPIRNKTKSRSTRNTGATAI